MACLKWPTNMKINLLPYAININDYKSNRSNIYYITLPDLLFRYMTVMITRPFQNEKGQWKMVKSRVKLVFYVMLDDIMIDLVNYMESLKKETGHYFDNHCYLTEFILDTDTMVATTRWSR